MLEPSLPNKAIAERRIEITMNAGPAPANPSLNRMTSIARIMLYQISGCIAFERIAKIVCILL